MSSNPDQIERLVDWLREAADALEAERERARAGWRIAERLHGIGIELANVPVDPNVRDKVRRMSDELGSLGSDLLAGKHFDPEWEQLEARAEQLEKELRTELAANYWLSKGVTEWASKARFIEQQLGEAREAIEGAVTTFEQRFRKRRFWDERKAVTYQEAARYLRLKLAALSPQDPE